MAANCGRCKAILTFDITLRDIKVDKPFIPKIAPVSNCPHHASSTTRSSPLIEYLPKHDMCEWVCERPSSIQWLDKLFSTAITFSFHFFFFISFDGQATGDVRFHGGILRWLWVKTGRMLHLHCVIGGSQSTSIAENLLALEDIPTTLNACALTAVCEVCSLFHYSTELKAEADEIQGKIPFFIQFAILFILFRCHFNDSSICQMHSLTFTLSLNS